MNDEENLNETTDESIETTDNSEENTAEEPQTSDNSEPEENKEPVKEEDSGVFKTLEEANKGYSEPL